MREIIVDETIEDMDKNKDGQVTLEEYISKLDDVIAVHSSSSAQS